LEESVGRVKLTDTVWR